LYDPDRSRTVRKGKLPSSWQEGLLALRSAVADAKAKGKTFRILTSKIVSPTGHQILSQILREHTHVVWHEFEPVGAHPARGADIEVRYDLSNADTILSLDADFFCGMPGHLALTRQFAARRDPEHAMNRLYCIEMTPTLAGGMADHRLLIRPSLFPRYLRALHQLLKGEEVAGLSPSHVQWLKALGRDLKAHPGRSVVIAG
jgi:molybdopterin-containing oxidoreductase family iron-sulfur binding subunit